LSKGERIPRERVRAKVRRRRPSTIAQLGDGARSELDRLLLEGKFSLSEITQRVQELGGNVSRSAIGRYAQYQEQVASDIRATREMAQAIGKELEDCDGDAGRLAIESVQTLLLRARMDLASGEEIDIKALSFLCGAVKDLQSAFKMNIETEGKIRDRVLKEAAQRVAKASTSRGMTAETVEFIKAQILGVKS
jgi:hypothetical protein